MPARKARTISSTWARPTPKASARSPAFWITGPSAEGSEKGTPSSMMSAPAFAMACISEGVLSAKGKPAVTNGIRALRPVALSWARVVSMRLMFTLY